MRTVLSLFLLGVSALSAEAAERRPRRPTPAPVPPIMREEPSGPQPALPSPWQGQLLLAIAGLFAAAAVIGPLYRTTNPEDDATAHAHDEPPGASDLYGPSGTLEPIPFDHRRV